MLLVLSGMVGTGCRRKEEAAEEKDLEQPWTEMRGQWEAMSGGQVDIGEPIRIGWGETLTAVRWTGEIPKPPFELELTAKRVDGSDFFCAVTFPARDEDELVTLVIGGWGGATVGISSIDGKDASENETTAYRTFETDVWYRVRLVCEGERIAAWIDGEKVFDVDTTGKALSLRDGSISECAPFGLATWQTTGMVRDVQWRKL
jgi:hypothetical protein